MNVKTGAILALSTKGDYDPNDPFTISQEAEDASRKRWKTRCKRRRKRSSRN